MAEDQAKEDLNAIVQAIGFGIVGDFRELRQSMYGITAEMDESNRLLGNVNQNLESTNRSLDQIEKDVYRQLDSRQFKQLENQIEAKNRQSNRRNDEVMRSVLSAVNDIKRQAGGIRVKIDSEGNVKESSTPPTGDTAPRGGSFLGAVGGAIATGVVLGAAAYMMSSSSSAADTSGAQPPSNLPSAPPMAPSLPTNNSPGPQMGGASMAPTPSQSGGAQKASSPAATPSVATRAPHSNVNLSNASQAVSAITATAQRKALAKVQTKSSNWFSRNGGRIVDTIGADNAAVFGALVDGRFSFNKYMSDDSWTNLGLAWLNGDPLPPPDQKNPNAAYVSEVIINLSIQAYLISREIYTAENAAEIESGVISNFDEVEDNDRKQVVKNIGSVLETYVNFLIDRTKTASSTKAAELASAAGANLAPVTGGGQQGAAMAGAAAAAGGSGGGPSGSPPGTSEPGGGSGGGGGEGGDAPAAAGSNDTGSGSSSATPSQSFSPTGEPGAQAQDSTPSEAPSSSSSMGQQQTDATVTPSDTTASFSTSANQGGSVGFESTVAKYGPRLMQDYGLTKEQAAAVLGNLGHESVGMTAGIQEKKPKSGRGGLGWAQWTGPRRRQFEAYLKDTGQAANDPEANYGFLKTELDSNYGSAIAALKNTSNVEEGVALFEHKFEVSADYDQKTGKVLKPQNVKSRNTYASKALRVLGNSDSAESSQSTDQTGDTTAPALATGGIITPLPSDKAQSNMSNSLAPSADVATGSYASGQDSNEDTSSTSMSPIDARSKKRSANPYDEAKNKISSYGYLMQHHFGHLKDDMKQAHEETTADDYHFGKALDPLA